MFPLFYIFLTNGMFSYAVFLWLVNLIVIILLSPSDQTTNGYTNILSDKLIKFWRRPFTRKRFHQIHPSNSDPNGTTSVGETNGGDGKPLIPVVYLFRRPKLQDSGLSGLSGFSGINGLSGFSGSNSNGLPAYVTLTDSDFIDEIDDSPQNQNQNSNPIISGINSAVQSLGLPNLPLSSGQSYKDHHSTSISVSPSSSSSGSNNQPNQIPIGSTSYDLLKPLDDFKKQIDPIGSFGHGFYGHNFHPHLHHPLTIDHSHKGHKIKYIHVPVPYPVIHVKHIKHHHQDDHKNDMSSWIWGILLAALLPILLGVLLLPLGLLFALNLFTLLAVLGPGGGTFIPINGTTGTISTGRKRKRSVSSELWDEKQLDETQAFVLDCIRRF